MTLDGWACAALPPAAVADPAGLGAARADWLSAPVPGTAAAALARHGRWDFDRPADIDALDWWYRTTFRRPAGGLAFLCFDGLATRAEVWLNGRPLLAADNMFRAYRVDVSDRLGADNELVIAFRSLAHDLKQKRPRPRWKTGLVAHQQLRWHRTTLLGRIPGWSPVAPPVGPWRAVRLETGDVLLSDVRLRSWMEGDVGFVTVEANIHSRLPVARPSWADGPVEIRETADGWSLHGRRGMSGPPRWWPHTHGDQRLFGWPVGLDAGGRTHTFDVGRVGFRTVGVEPGDGFGLRVNGEPVWCRGACWTVSDLVAFGGSEEAIRRDLELARAAGANMVRVGGTTAYEADAFYRLCDELGLLVWQDFMFANMDYPAGDPAFAANVEAEAEYQLGRLSAHPCVAVYCGNSEVEQQAAMLGLPRDTWTTGWFSDRLPELCAQRHPGTVYVPSTPTGGALPFHVRTGVAHYYGVGAYRRPVEDARRADVRFTTECLGFANVPDRETLDSLTGGSGPAVLHPAWKRRVPRDTGADWDFDDVRDFYLPDLFGVDPVGLRSSDPKRYLELSRVASGEVMARVFAEWRGRFGNNRGALVWFFKDLWPGAGWGVVDSTGRPKAAYYALKRAWHGRQLVVTDEGLDGLCLHAINELAEPLRGSAELVLYRDHHTVVARAGVPVEIGPRSTWTVGSDQLLGGFHDVTYAYRFGPPGHDVAVATLYDEGRAVVSEAFHFVRRRDPAPVPARLEADVAAREPGRYRVTLAADWLLEGVRLRAKGYLPDDNYFHLPPGRRKAVAFAATTDPAADFAVEVGALNVPAVAMVRAGARRAAEFDGGG
jgi:beta-mannosidase